MAQRFWSAVTVTITMAGGCLALSGCAAVHQEDLDAWKGAPVAELEKHPFLMTLPVVRTVASDGTEIRRYINGRNIESCSGGGAVFKGVVDSATYNTFSNCMQTFAACNAVFYIKDGHIQDVAAIGTGGMRCYTDETLRPGFRGSANVR